MKLTLQMLVLYEFPSETNVFFKNIHHCRCQRAEGRWTCIGGKGYKVVKIPEIVLVKNT